MKRNVLTQYLIITASCALYAVGFNWMFDPNHISVGGFTGLGQIINYLLPGLPIGTIVIILNVPLFVLGWRFIGKDFLFSSVYATAVSSLMIDGLAAVHTFKPMEPILGCIFGCVIMGGSLGVVFLQGATTGGTDLIARLLKLRFGHLPMGTLVMAVDLVVIARVIPRRPSYFQVFAKPAAASALMGLGAWAVYGLLSKVLMAAGKLCELDQATQKIVGLSRTGNGLAVICAILVAVAVYGILIIALRAITREDLALMPKGEKIARILHLS